MVNVKVVWYETECNKPNWVNGLDCELCNDCKYYGTIEKRYYGEVKEVSFDVYETSIDYGDILSILHIRINQQRKMTITEQFNGEADQIEYLEIDGDVLVKDFIYIEND